MRKQAILLAALAALTLALAGCGGGDSKDNGDDGGQAVFDVFFPPEHADALAHAALPEPADMPGPGWEVSARDEFDDDDEDDAEFDEAFDNEPACAELNALDQLDGFFGESSDDDQPVGRAKIELANALQGGRIPTGVEVEVEIAQTVAEVEGSWELVREVIENDKLEECMVAALNSAFAESNDPDLEGAEVSVSAREPSNDAPNGGATMAFDMHMKIIGIEVDMAFEMYFWPHGNASASVFIVGTDGNVDRDLTEGVLDAVDQKLTNVGEMASAQQ